MAAPILRVGLANPNGRMAIEMERRSIPVMVSANSLFDHEKRRFRDVPMHLTDLDVSLDSAGFVALSRYGRYPWSVAQYVELAITGGFSWWSQMDCCCEREVAGDGETVTARVRASATLLAMCREKYFDAMRSCPGFETAALPPMPILQGWQPDDYKLSSELVDDVLGGDWPDMIGVGSVCRRNLNGPDGLWRILQTLDTFLPAHVNLHMFGIKGSALSGLGSHPRVVSVDSMAFEMRARIESREAKVSKTIDFRIETMEKWIARQLAHVAVEDRQLTLAV